jgi:UDP-N-acetylmuramoylalanine--D-glutamate ligase
MSDQLAGKRVVVLGLARQGSALARWLCGIGARVTVSDLRPASELAAEMDMLLDLPITFALGSHPPNLLDEADLVCLSGGVPTDTPIAQEALERGILLSNDAQIFLERSPALVIGITGSAGKTTTTALVGAMCEATGEVTWVGGNIGNPLIADLEAVHADDHVVMELSSFQLEIMTVSPHVGAVLNVTPNHLDRHKTMEAYSEAKAHILDYQVVGDMAVLGRDDPGARALAGRVRAGLAWFSGREAVEAGAWLEEGRLLWRRDAGQAPHEVCELAEVRLRGYHNVLNVLAAIAIAGAAGVPVEAMTEAIRTFDTLTHRLETVRVVNGVTYVNDSIATAPERVAAAIQAFHDEPLVLLLGGRDKALPWDDMLRLAVQRARYVVTFGEAGPMIAARAEKARDGLVGAAHVLQADSLSNALEMAARLARRGDVVLLSPGCTSFDAYLDFEERGEHFRQLVNGL